MGRAAAASLAQDERFEVVGGLVRHASPSLPVDTFPLFTDPDDALRGVRPDIWLDFTDARSVVEHVDLAIERGVRPVVGATGYTVEDVERWNNACLSQGTGGIAAPNFAVGALLMIRFAAEAARFFPNAEIIELHHDGKRDAPSGTAVRTAIAMANQGPGQVAADLARAGQVPRTETDALNSPARGAVHEGIHVHSVRLPGLVAHQEVIFGGVGETLTIRHDSLSRESFMEGVRIACARVFELTGMVYGLEHVLW
ncbi:MAG: 4-hydroxy-tetrahydrodipicolinate reductase [Alicyclobacillus sp.]|nr:4-hydroxy-tetrahydrodipicolinate reductase [Alicyclobacillus sp.]